ncbi:hypothetical protein KXW36_001407, partial [Aspergillus fumigatus]
LTGTCQFRVLGPLEMKETDKGLSALRLLLIEDDAELASRLSNRLRDAAGLDDDAMTAGVLATPVPNAFALPGGKVFVLQGLLDKAESPDELAGILAHELGHLKHHDNMRGLIYNGGTSFLIGLLFDLTSAIARPTHGYGDLIDEFCISRGRLRIAGHQPHCGM